MIRSQSRYRWFVFFVFFCFVLLHQADKLLIGPLTTPIMEAFDINEAQMGAVSSMAIIVAAVLYPVWGYLYDRYARARLLALASLIWGSTTWLNALAPTYTLFLFTRASTGIDDSSYPGMWSLLSDYFGPRIRGKVYGLLQVAHGAGILMAILIFFGVREPQRGQSEPEMADLAEVAVHRIDKQVLLGLLRNRSYLLLISQGFFGVFPWQVLTFWFFRYLETERGYTGDQAMITMIVAIATLSVGYFFGGVVGDFFFRRTPRGRTLTSMVGVLAGAAFLFLTMSVPVGNQGLFMGLLAFTGVTMSVAAPNVVATIHDVTEPEVRSTAHAVLAFAENFGSAVAPWLAGVIAVRHSLQVAIVVICVSTWLACAGLFAATSVLVPGDIERLRRTMRARAEQGQSHGVTA
jgi:MFS family permease